MIHTYTAKAIVTAMQVALINSSHYCITVYSNRDQCHVRNQYQKQPKPYQLSDITEENNLKSQVHSDHNLHPSTAVTLVASETTEISTTEHCRLPVKRSDLFLEKCLQIFSENVLISLLSGN